MSIHYHVSLASSSDYDRRTSTGSPSCDVIVSSLHCGLKIRA
jgi:hypothetical protein